MYARAPQFVEACIPVLPRGLPAIEDGLALAADRLMHAAARDAEVARLQLGAALRQLRGIDLGGTRGLTANLALVSIVLDRVSANVKTACEIALGGGADLDRSRAHSILASMRENLQDDANELVAGRTKPGEFYPELEVNADRLLRIMRDQVQHLAPEQDQAVRVVRERAH